MREVNENERRSSSSSSGEKHCAIIIFVNRKTEDSVGIHTIYEFGYFISSLIYVFLSVSFGRPLAVSCSFHSSNHFHRGHFRTLCPRHELVAALCKLLLQFLVVLFCCVLFLSLFLSIIHFILVVVFHLRVRGGSLKLSTYTLYTHKHTIHLHIILFNADIIIVIIIIYYFSSNRYESP